KWLRYSVLGIIILMLFSLYLLNPVKAEPAAILKVSLPDGTYVGPDSDPWLSECWLLNLTGTSQTFTVRINNTSAAKRSYDTHLIIALNDIGYNSLENLVVNSTSIPKSAFRYGTPTPYNLWTWPSGDVYPTWFNDTYVNVGTIPRKGYKEVVVSVTFSNTIGIRMHFDAYGSKVDPPPPIRTGDITHNSISEDSTILFQPGPPALQHPIAKFFYDPAYPNTEEVVTFNASESYDPDGYIVSYSWNFGDGTPIVIESDPVINHTYTAFGNYTVTLIVTDNDGLTDNSTATLSVRQHPVAALIFSPSDPLEHEIVTFDASASTPDGGVIISYEWNFGDGNITTVTSPSINHTYSTFGNYTVTLNVTDSEGKWDTESKSIMVEALPTADFWWSPSYPYTFENVTFDASDSTPDGGVLISYAWNFGDGTPVVIESDPITIHYYTTNGSFTVTLNVTDSEGEWDTESKIITVRPRRYYLTVKTNPVNITTIQGEGWYNENTNVSLTAPDFVPVSIGVQYNFSYWDVDNNTVLGNPIVVRMDDNHTATAHYVLQYYLTLTTDPSDVTTPSGEGWYDTGTNASISTDEIIDIVPGSSRYKFSGWTTANMSEITDPASPLTTVYMDRPKTVTANYEIQYFITFDYTGLDPTATGTVVTINGTSKTYSNLPNSTWVNSGSTIIYSYYNVSSTTLGKRFILINVTGSPSPITVNKSETIVGHYKTQYQLTVRTNGLNTYSTNVYNGTASLGTATDAAPYVDWFDEGSSLQLNIDSPITFGSTRFVFTQWSGDATGTSRPLLVNMNSAKDITANYKTQYRITVTATPNGAIGGTFKVTYTQCGTTYTNVQNTTEWSEWADAGTDVTVSAPQDVIGVSYDTRYKFDSYTPSSSVTMNQAKTIILVYKTQYLLTVLTDPAGLSPQPTRSPQGEAGPVNSWWYDKSTSVQLTAHHVINYTFREWTVNDISKGAGVKLISVSMNAPHTAIAYYEYTPTIVGGSTVSIKSPLFPVWISLNIMLIAAIFITVSWIKRQRKKTC
ncbi:MAG: PKD domain-containing protein, partial [Candidatus Bathyarchaeia archaeon]